MMGCYLRCSVDQWLCILPGLEPEGADQAGLFGTFVLGRSLISRCNVQGCKAPAQQLMSCRMQVSLPAGDAMFGYRHAPAFAVGL